jgi:hypothetical protein
MTSIDGALLLFDKWCQERTQITCALISSGLQIQFIGTVDNIEAGAITMSTRNEAGSLRLALHSVHEFRYCDPREIGDPEAEEKFAGFLIMRLLDGNVLHFAEPK